MITRRTFIQSLPFLVSGLYMGCTDNTTHAATSTVQTSNPQWRMSDEGEPHQCTWMAYGATAEAWGTTGNYGASRAIARKDLMRIAGNLSRFEPVKVLVTNEQDRTQAEQFLAQIRSETVSASSNHYEPNTVFTGGKTLPAIEAGGRIEFIVQPVNDLWTRDTTPVFVRGASKELGAVNFNFNGWGQEPTGDKNWRKDPNKKANGIQDQRVTDDQKVADFIIAQTGVTKIDTWLVMEGGGIEVNGQGTAICTESCILNPNRNPNRSKTEVENELKRVLGIDKIIWLKGVPAREITDGHVDFYARFVNATTVLYTLDNDPQSSDYQATQEHKRILESATDAHGKPITAIAMPTPEFDTLQPMVEQRNWNAGASKFNAESFAAGYVGFYAANGCILMAQFGDAAADKAAFEQLQTLYPDRTIMQITTDGLANGGGTIHCATQQQIKL